MKFKDLVEAGAQGIFDAHLDTDMAPSASECGVFAHRAITAAFDLLDECGYVIVHRRLMPAQVEAWENARPSGFDPEDDLLSSQADAEWAQADFDAFINSAEKIV